MQYLDCLKFILHCQLFDSVFFRDTYLAIYIGFGGLLLVKLLRYFSRSGL